GQDVDLRIRLGGRRGPVPGAPRVFAVPPRQGRDEIPGGPHPLGRQRRPRGPDARAQIRGSASGGLDGRARTSPHRAALGSRRRGPREGGRRAARGRVRLPALRDGMDGRGAEGCARTRRMSYSSGPPAAEVPRRRTFAIISHPDAGKTTLTEKLLLYGGAIH